MTRRSNPVANEATAKEDEKIAAEFADDSCTDGDVDEPAAGTGDSGTDVRVSVATAKGRKRRLLSWSRRYWAALLVAALLVGCVGTAAGVYWQMYRPDQQTNAAVSKQVLDAATQGTISTLSYSAETFDKDLTAAKAHLTGQFLKYYSQFADRIVAPAVKQKQVKTTASVIKASVAELHPDKAVVLVFVDQVTTSTDRPEPALAISSILVTVAKNQDRWLISELNPI